MESCKRGFALWWQAVRMLWSHRRHLIAADYTVEAIETTQPGDKYVRFRGRIEVHGHADIRPERGGLRLMERDWPFYCSPEAISHLTDRLADDDLRVSVAAPRVTSEEEANSLAAFLRARGFDVTVRWSADDA